ncbi:MAG: dTDP-4-dehydrorhamnose 3,5-epimerase family protein [Thermoguttaceae bacterium]
MSIISKELSHVFIDFFTSKKRALEFVEGPIHGVVIKPVLIQSDQRGWLAEIYRQDELSPEGCPVMAYISETLPGVSRGPHEHAAQTDYFAFIGPGDFDLYLWDIRVASPTWGNRIKMNVGQSNKQIVIVPPGIVHAYKNVGSVPGWVINQPNRLYAGAGRQEAVDEIRHENLPDTPFILN